MKTMILVNADHSRKESRPELLEKRPRLPEPRPKYGQKTGIGLPESLEDFIEKGPHRPKATQDCRKSDQNCQIKIWDCWKTEQDCRMATKGNDISIIRNCRKTDQNLMKQTIIARKADQNCQKNVRDCQNPDHSFARKLYRIARNSRNLQKKVLIG